MLPAAGLTLNQFGLDGAALWSNVAAGNDPRADLTGKNLASVLVMVPLATVSAFVCARVHARLGVPAAHARARARDLRRAARRRRRDVGEASRTRCPTAATRSRSIPARVARRCSPASRALAVEGVLLIPVAVLAVVLLTTQSLAVATVVTVVVANAYGAMLWLVGRELAARDVWWRLPELLDAVSPRARPAEADGLTGAGQRPCTAGTKRARYDVRCT